MLAWFYWDPPRNVFTLPGLGRPVAWYGVLFAAGFAIGYHILLRLFCGCLESDARYQGNRARIKEVATFLADRFTWTIVIATIIGARCGHVFFYEWSHFSSHLADIFKVWEGGLASHGAAIGILTALALFRFWVRREQPALTYLVLLDCLVVPTALAAVFIRVGNFVNQEILGKVTSVPWAILFGHPFDGSSIEPRHPVQLYEALAYLITFIVIYGIAKKRGGAPTEGMLSGLFFVLVFSSRFLIEFFKMPQAETDIGSLLTMGQLLVVSSTSFLASAM